MSGQLGFAEAFLAAKAGQNARLERISAALDWARFKVILEVLVSAGGPGRPAYPVLAMFKAMLLAQWYRLSDPALEEALADRISFRRFCDFTLDAMTPDETTLCRFRKRTRRGGAGRSLDGGARPAAGQVRRAGQGRHHDRCHAGDGAGGEAAR